MNATLKIPATALILAAILLFPAAAQAKHKSKKDAAPTSINFEVGQEWSVKDSDMLVIVGRVEPWNPGTLVGITLLNVPCPEGAPCKTTNVGYLPMDSAALSKSVDKLVASNVALTPHFEEGYAGWKEAQGGVFKFTVQEMPGVLFSAVQGGAGQLAPPKDTAAPAASETPPAPDQAPAQ